MVKENNDATNEKTTKEVNPMTALAQNQYTNKDELLQELKESLIELSEKRKNNSQIQNNTKSSWRNLFEDEEE